jgi:hypothetical protein
VPPPVDSWEHREPEFGYLIRSTQEYVVFLDRDGDLDWETIDEFDAKLANKEFGGLSNRIGLLQAMPSEYLSRANRRAFGIMLGEALVRGLDGDPKTGNEMLDQATEFVRERNLELAREWYLEGVGFAFVATGLVALSGGLLQSSTHGGARGVEIAVVGGAVGAVFSVLARASAIPLNASSGPRLHHLEGASRVAVGAIGGAVVALAILAHLVLPGWATPAGFALGGMAGGFSERLASNLIDHVQVAALNADGTIQKQSGKSPHKR